MTSSGFARAKSRRPLAASTEVAADEGDRGRSAQQVVEPGRDPGLAGGDLGQGVLDDRVLASAASDLRSS